ncbi:uncharacterized protein YdaL [Pedobacter sp. CG_S7]|uniref:DUF3347 domain-containing protein n=1 Tax=Pedobacter sp. CG_S7 TaxID=3143930 RepID=UPI003398A3C8
MKTTLKTILTLSFVTLLAACSDNQPKEESHEGHNHGTEAQAVASVSSTATTVSIKDDNLNAVFQHYQKLTNALTEGNVAEAKVAAVAIETGAKEIQSGSTLAFTAAKITNAVDLETQRTTYADLSKEFIDLLKITGLGSGELYVAHCPMALNDKGATWVSNSKEIRNPYFGESMLTCGTVNETIK